MKTILITNDPALAEDAQSAGVSRIMVDLETHGKKERQAARTTFISNHAMSDIALIRNVLTSTQLMVRINPWHAESHDEVEGALRGGAEILMLPMITKLDQLEQCIESVRGRVQVLPLIETAYAMAHIQEIAAHYAIPELYIGLNDLHLSLGLDFLFEPLALGLIDWMATQIKFQGKTFGFGGVAAIGGAGELSPESVLGEHARLGSSRVILSSRFVKDVELSLVSGRAERLKLALVTMQQYYVRLAQRSPDQQEEDRLATRERILQIARRAS